MSFQPDTRYAEGDIRRWLRPDERRALVALCCEDLTCSKIVIQSTVPPLSKFPKAQRSDPKIIAVRERAAKRASDLMNDRFQAHGAGTTVRLLWRLAAEREAAAGGKIFDIYADGDDPLPFVGPDPTPEPQPAQNTQERPGAPVKTNKMTTYDRCCAIRNALLSRAAEVMTYTNWSPECAVASIRELPKRITKNAASKPIQLGDLTDTQMADLGFARWSEEDPMRLIPLWLLPFLPDAVEAVSISGKKIHQKADMDLEPRFGCLAYGVYPADVKHPVREEKL